MCHDVQISHSEDDNSVRRVSVIISKVPELKGDNSHQRQAASLHRIRLVGRVRGRGNRDVAAL
jgi:hypothetical protein